MGLPRGGGQETLPMEALDGQVPAAIIADMEKEEAEEAEAKEAAFEGFEDDMGENENEPLADENMDPMDEMQALEEGMKKALHDAGEMHDDSEEEEDDQNEYLLADSDDEPKDFGMVSAHVQKVKSFNSRPAFKELEDQMLTQLPRHIGGCSVSYHGKEQRWQGIYPGAKKGMSCSWGGQTHRTEKDAIMQVVESVLSAHLVAYPKDALWKAQLDRVKAARATHSY